MRPPTVGTTSTAWAERVLATLGASGALTLAFGVLFNPGDEILIP